MCFAAILAFSAVTVASASAAEVLFSSATGTFKAVGGPAKLFGASEVKCEKTATEGELENKHLTKKLKITFEKCKASGFNCTGSKDTITGNITFEGILHLGLGRKVATEAAHAAVLILVPGTFSFTCELGGKIEVKGSVIGLTT